ncbi:MAG: hypothetical protein NDJ89_14210 [Oligoflexia bacterium]|nr:hypothetical protein [Oligoflexia bacterium]
MTQAPNSAEVRGHQALTRPAPVSARIRARLVDLALCCTLFAALFGLTGFWPALRWWWFPLLGTLAGLYGLLALALLKSTPGELAWGLRRRGTLFQAQSPAASRQAIAIFLTAASIGLAALACEHVFLRHPLWRSAQNWALTPFLPPLAQERGGDSERWTVLPYYYLLGAWPTRYEGQPIFYGLPYEKGPPERFLGRIVARWNPPHALLTIEGPKTPERLEQETYERIRRCLSSPLERGCRRIREAALRRHVTEMEKAVGGAREWDLRWFTVENPALPDPERARGFFLGARGAVRGQDRVVLVTSKGTHQAFYMEYSTAPAAGHDPARARELLTQSLRSLRTSEELGPGRSWTERLLQDTRLAELQAIRDPDALIQRLAGIQALLLSRLSVEPRTFDAYYHLGGISLTLFRRSLVHPDRLRGSEWAAVARPMIESAHAYARDVRPEDPRTQELQNFLLEIQKR